VETDRASVSVPAFIYVVVARPSSGDSRLGRSWGCTPPVVHLQACALSCSRCWDELGFEASFAWYPDRGSAIRLGLSVGYGLRARMGAELVVGGGRMRHVLCVPVRSCASSHVPGSV
jgi:hypothetical protein